MPVTQCAAVITRSPAGLSTTVAVQKCWFSPPEEVVNSAPTGGVPPNACPAREDGVVRWRTARTKPLAMSPAAPLPGASVTATPTASATSSAALVGDQAIQEAR